MKNGRPGVMFYLDILPALEKLPLETVGTLFLASMRYAQTEEAPAFDDAVLNFAWALIKPAIDRDGERYEEKKSRGEWLTYCRRCKQDGIEPMDFETYRQHTVNDALQTVTDTQPTPSTTTASSTTTATTPNIGIGADKPPKRPRFVPPTLEEVTAYVQERGSNVDPQEFIDSYTMKGWLVGKTPMKDWKAACRNAEKWERWTKKDGQRDRVRTDADYEGGDSFV